MKLSINYSFFTDEHGIEYVTIHTTDILDLNNSINWTITKTAFDRFSMFEITNITKNMLPLSKRL